MELVDYILKRHFLSEKEIKKIGIFDELFYDFMSAKLYYNNIIKNYDCNIISLGTFCQPKTLAVKWGLSSSLAQGMPRLPFDLAIHPIKSLNRLLHTKFSRYYVNIFKNEDESIIINKIDDSIIFNHEIVEGDKNKYLQTFNSIILPERVRNFNKYLSLKKNLYLCSGPFDDSALADIYQLKLYLTKHSDGPLVVLTSRQLPDESPYFYYLSTKCEVTNYNWNNVACWFTDAGFDYEQGIIKFIIDIIYDNFNTAKSVLPPPHRKNNLYNLYLRLSEFFYKIGETYFSNKYLYKAYVENNGNKPPYFIEI